MLTGDMINEANALAKKCAFKQLKRIRDVLEEKSGKDIRQWLILEEALKKCRMYAQGDK